METRRGPELLQKYAMHVDEMPLNMAPANNRSYVLQADSAVEKAIGGGVVCQAFVFIVWRAHRMIVRTSWNPVLFCFKSTQSSTKRPIIRTRVRLKHHADLITSV
jgi:hypothetical protein